MKSMMKKIIISISLLFIAWLDPFSDEVKKGNRYFSEEKYDEALESYRRALEIAPDEEREKKLSFNKGAASQGSGDLEKAIEEYRRALEADDPELKKRSLFNKGNAWLESGDESKAFEAYRHALEIDPDYEKPKKNIEHILKRQQQPNHKRGDSPAGGQESPAETDREHDPGPGEDEAPGEPGPYDEPERTPGDYDKKIEQMSPEEARALLDSLDKAPPGRKKGKDHDAKHPEKYW